MKPDWSSSSVTVYLSGHLKEFTGGVAEIEINPTDDGTPATAPTETAHEADAVSADEIAALTAGDARPAAPASTRTLHLGAAAGIGIASRSFDPSPSTVTGYTSSPAAAFVVEARIEPTADLALSVATEHTLQLPVYASLTERDLSRIIEVIRGAVRDSGPLVTAAERTSQR